MWTNIEELIANGYLVATDEVEVELSKKGDAVHEWTLGQPKLYQPLTEEVQIQVSEILLQFPRLVDERKERSQADPFVIAQAIVSGGVVVTGEKEGREGRPRIPYVCNQLGIDCITFLQFIQRNGWKF